MSDQGMERPPETEEEARALFLKMQKRSKEIQEAFRQSGTTNCSTWLNFEPVLVPASVEGGPAQAKLRCLHCNTIMSAANPSRTQTQHIEKGSCLVYKAKVEAHRRSVAARGAAALQEEGRDRASSTPPAPSGNPPAQHPAGQATSPTQPPPAKRAATVPPNPSNPSPLGLASYSVPPPLPGIPAPGSLLVPGAQRLSAGVMLEARVTLATYHELQNMSSNERRSVGAILDELVALRAGGNPLAPRNSYIPARASFNPLVGQREAPIDLKHSALLFIDCQNFNCSPDGALYGNAAKAPQYSYWWGRIAECKLRWSALQTRCRQAGLEVMYTVMESLTSDGRDRSLDYKISGYHLPPKSYDSQVLGCIQPGPDEIVLPKTSSSVFTTTSIAKTLHNLGTRSLILVGCLTDQCVESAVRDACDLNFLVTLVTDACATYSAARHDNSIQAIKGYCRQRTTDQLIEEIDELSRTTGTT